MTGRRMPRASCLHGYSGHRLRHRFNELLEAVDRGVATLREDPRVRRAHILRVHVKKLRYATELLVNAHPRELTELLPRLIHLQRALGELHDCALRVDWLRQNSRAGSMLLPGLLHGWSQAAFQAIH